MTDPDLGLTVLRLTFGALTFAHGYQKWGNMDKFCASWGLSRPTAVAVAVVQTVGGALILLGFLTQLSALANCAVNAAILHALITKSDEPFLAPARHSWSIGVAYLGMALALALGGGGALAVDRLF
ncbi:DoxX family protein [Dinoroseobacter sp. S76]|uniref:DoxX family protein n=1 Tax=Dinoroseobacter sp. S76 TaxID=3415124 RepID=UPI003C7C83E9